MSANPDSGPAETLSAAWPTDMEEAAESWTGGLLASLLTDVEGASHAFERGFLAYSEAAKCELLGVARVSRTAWGRSEGK